MRRSRDLLPLLAVLPLTACSAFGHGDAGRAERPTSAAASAPAQGTGVGIRERRAARTLARLARGWTPLPPAPVRRSSAAHLFTGSELVVWGGDTLDATHHRDGAAFDVVSRRWTNIPRAPITGRSRPGAAWTGREVVVWGGHERRTLGDGAAFDPATRTWRLLPEASLAPRIPVATVWTGEEVLVWGNAVRAAAWTDGAAYDPAADRWRRLPDAPFALNQATAVWTGDEMIVVGSLLDGRNHADVPSARALAYRPTTDSWRVLPSPGLSPQASTAVWDGRRVIAWDYELAARAYDPAGDRWTRVRGLPLPFSECYPDGAAVRGAVVAFHCGALTVLDRPDRAWRRAPTPAPRALWDLAGASDEVVFFLGPRLWAYRP